MHQTAPMAVVDGRYQLAVNVARRRLSELPVAAYAIEQRTVLGELHDYVHASRRFDAPQVLNDVGMVESFHNVDLAGQELIQIVGGCAQFRHHLDGYDFLLRPQMRRLHLGKAPGADGADDVVAVLLENCVGHLAGVRR